jgi:N6-L-threonylcarbamoyladenine synthase
MKILSIETSCDDTGITLLEAKGSISNASFKVIANASNSQIKIHAEYGGVYPMLAKNEHIKNLPTLLEKVLKKLKLQKLTNSAIAENVYSKSPVDLITVTYGPGLEPALWAGIAFAKELAKKWEVPIMPVNHMEGHIFSVFGKNKGKFIFPKINFPVLSLLVSGGHTQLILSKSLMKYEVIGETLDDAAGEAFDKVARMLDLPYPGGPKISRLASQARKLQIKNYKLKIKLPRPMIYSKNFDFSFSGLKTAVLYLIRKIGKLDEKTKMQIALEFENAVIETLVYKTIKAKNKYDAKTVIVSGGVSSNKYLRQQMKKFIGKNIKLLFPGKGLATDNSIMIGIAGYLQFIKNKGKTIKPDKIKAEGGLRL